MKRVLIICYYWPPAGGSAVQRWLRFVRHLPANGWTPVVYTVENGDYPAVDPDLEKLVPEGVEVMRRPIWEPYGIYRRSLGGGKIHPGLMEDGRVGPTWRKKIGRWIRGNFFIPDARRYWIRPSIRYLVRYLRRSPVDVIISSGPPHSLHLIAHALHKKTSTPWIADFRDPWTSMDYYREMYLTHWADRRHHRLEGRIITDASAVVVVGPAMKKEFEEKYRRPVQVIMNGFDDATLPAVGAMDQRFTLTHVGGLLKNRNPYSLWKALARLINSEPAFAEALEVRLVGTVDATVTTALEREGLLPFVRRVPQVAHAEALRMQASAWVLLLPIDKLPNAEFVLSGKLFEYLRAARPILCIGPVDGDAAAVIRETGSGVTCGFDDVGPLEQHVLEQFRRFQNRDSAFTAHGIARFSGAALTRELSDLMNDLIDH